MGCLYKEKIVGEKILFVESDKQHPHYLEVYTETKQFKIRESLKRFEECHEELIRTSISTLSNPLYIKKIYKRYSAFVIQFKEDGKEAELSRHYWQKHKKLLKQFRWFVVGVFLLQNINISLFNLFL
ncbi:LytTR family DNA-binding domain-containing protein [Lactococcus nasutitermitis]|uniref:LytTR family DNA-binding domain-containing protein n=1 Tax=Lactococcus nasutitermitis TaxID=1652957 RepID=A0ABV9JBA9_9LACT|nr:LytTR family DNA-binding domain-containing protein [Lactococcus nasutitermitis]